MAQFEAKETFAFDERRTDIWKIFLRRRVVVPTIQSNLFCSSCRREKSQPNNGPNMKQTNVKQSVMYLHKLKCTIKRVVKAACLVCC